MILELILLAVIVVLVLVVVALLREIRIFERGRRYSYGEKVDLTGVRIDFTAPRYTTVDDISRDTLRPTQFRRLG